MKAMIPSKEEFEDIPKATRRPWKGRKGQKGHDFFCERVRRHSKCHKKERKGHKDFDYL